MAHLRPHRIPNGARKGEAPGAEKLDTADLESLLGYNARRAARAGTEVFFEAMAARRLRPVDFSALLLIAHNPGITSLQLCPALGILPPNLVGMLNALEKRELIFRQPHPRDGRAMALQVTPKGEKLTRDA